MVMAASPKEQGKQSIGDWLAQPEAARLELIDGELVVKAAPTFAHGRAQRNVGGLIGGPYDRKPGGPRGPGGWWIATEVDIVLEGRGFRPDVVGWRREQVPVAPRERPVTQRPDWICEIVSDSNRATDTIVKLRRYHQAQVGHYWILDELDRTLTVHRHTPEGYLVVLRAGADERVRAEPFEAIDLHVGHLLGDDE
jgi:Uma2 family endonuclease